MSTSKLPFNRRPFLRWLDLPNRQAAYPASGRFPHTLPSSQTIELATAMLQLFTVNS